MSTHLATYGDDSDDDFFADPPDPPISAMDPPVARISLAKQRPLSSSSSEDEKKSFFERIIDRVKHSSSESSEDEKPTAAQVNGWSNPPAPIQLPSAAPRVNSASTNLTSEAGSDTETRRRRSLRARNSRQKPATSSEESEEEEERSASAASARDVLERLGGRTPGRPPRPQSSLDFPRDSARSAASDRSTTAPELLLDLRTVGQDNNDDDAASDVTEVSPVTTARHRVAKMNSDDMYNLMKRLIADIDEERQVEKAKDYNGEIVGNKRSSNKLSNKNYSFNSSAQRKIDAENERLLTQISKMALSRRADAKRARRPASAKAIQESFQPASRLHSAGINRQREQRRIEDENKRIISRLEGIKPTRALTRNDQLGEWQTIRNYGVPTTSASSRPRPQSAVPLSGAPSRPKTFGSTSSLSKRSESTASLTSAQSTSRATAASRRNNRQELTTWQPGW